MNELTYPLEHGVSIISLDVKEHHQDTSEDYIYHHLCKQTAELRKYCQFVEMEVKEILIFLGVLIFQYFQIIFTLCHLVLLPRYHHHAVEAKSRRLGEGMEHCEKVDYYFVWIVDYGEDKGHQSKKHSILGCPVPRLTIEIPLEIKLFFFCIGLFL
mgnify:CR=1 FL=1